MCVSLDAFPDTKEHALLFKIQCRRRRHTSPCSDLYLENLLIYCRAASVGGECTVCMGGKEILGAKAMCASEEKGSGPTMLLKIYFTETKAATATFRRASREGHHSGW